MGFLKKSKKKTSSRKGGADLATATVPTTMTVKSSPGPSPASVVVNRNATAPQVPSFRSPSVNSRLPTPKASVPLTVGHTTGAPNAEYPRVESGGKEQRDAMEGKRDLPSPATVAAAVASPKNREGRTRSRTSSSGSDSRRRRKKEAASAASFAGEEASEDMAARARARTDSDSMRRRRRQEASSSSSMEETNLALQQQSREPPPTPPSTYPPVAGLSPRRAPPSPVPNKVDNNHLTQAEENVFDANYDREVRAVMEQVDAVDAEVAEDDTDKGTSSNAVETSANNGGVDESFVTDIGLNFNSFAPTPKAGRDTAMSNIPGGGGKMRGEPTVPMVPVAERRAEAENSNQQHMPQSINLSDSSHEESAQIAARQISGLAPTGKPPAYPTTKSPSYAWVCATDAVTNDGDDYSILADSNDGAVQGNGQQQGQHPRRPTGLQGRMMSFEVVDEKAAQADDDITDLEEGSIFSGSGTDKGDGEGEGEGEGKDKVEGKGKSDGEDAGKPPKINKRSAIKRKVKKMQKNTERKMTGDSFPSMTKAAQRRKEVELKRAQTEGDGRTRARTRSSFGVDDPELQGAPSEIRLRSKGKNSILTALEAARKGRSGRDDVQKTEKTRKEKRASEGLLRSKHKKACNNLREANLEEALSEFEEILSILVSSYGHSHRRVGAALHNIGIVQVRSGRYDEALDAIEEAVRIRRGALGPNHPKVADSLVELGIALLSMEEYEDSLDIFHEALEMRETEAEIVAEESDSDSEDEEDSQTRRKRRAEEEEKAQLAVSKVLNNIGCVHFEAGDPEEALSTYEEALEIQREIVEERSADEYDVMSMTRHPAALNLASTLCNIGYVRMELGQWSEAIQVFKEAAGIQEEGLEPGNKLCVNTFDNLAYSKLLYKNYIGSIKTYKKILNIQDSCGQGDELEGAETRWKMVHAHLNLCEYTKALDHLTVIEDIQERELGKDSSEYRATKELIGWLRYETLKYPSPIEVLSRMLTSRKMSNPCTERLCCACSSRNINEVDLASLCEVRMPENSCKMSGHKVSYA